MAYQHITSSIVVLANRAAVNNDAIPYVGSTTRTGISFFSDSPVIGLVSLPFILAIRFRYLADRSHFPFSANQRGDSIIYLGKNRNTAIGKLVIHMNVFHSPTSQNAIGIRHIPIDRDIACIIATLARLSLEHHRFVFT